MQQKLHFCSDIKIKLSSGKEVFAHKFILSARNKGWGLLESGSVIGKDNSNDLGFKETNFESFSDWSHLDCDVSLELLRWVYTNHVR